MNRYIVKISLFFVYSHLKSAFEAVEVEGENRWSVMIGSLVALAAMMIDGAQVQMDSHAAQNPSALMTTQTISSDARWWRCWTAVTCLIRKKTCSVIGVVVVVVVVCCVCCCTCWIEWWTREDHMFLHFIATLCTLTAHNSNNHIFGILE